MLNISNLCKTYPNGVKTLDHCSLRIDKGMTGLLGPNGAGKSTLMRTIATLQRPDSGCIHFCGSDIWKAPMELRKHLGYLPQEFGVYPKISAEKLLDYFALLKGISIKRERQTIIQEVLELVNLYHDRKKYVSDYSGGMKQRFGIAQLLLNNPKLIIVDEPTAGLDPAERRRFLALLKEISTRNTVIFSTHIVEDVKELCQEVTIMNKGKLLAHINTARALKDINGMIWTKSIASDQLPQAALNYHVLSSNYHADNSLEIRIFSETPPDSSFHLATPQLEDFYFLKLNA